MTEARIPPATPPPAPAHPLQQVLAQLLQAMAQQGNHLGYMSVGPGASGVLNNGAPAEVLLVVAIGTTDVNATVRRLATGEEVKSGISDLFGQLFVMRSGGGLAAD